MYMRESIQEGYAHPFTNDHDESYEEINVLSDITRQVKVSLYLITELQTKEVVKGNRYPLLIAPT